MNQPKNVNINQNTRKINSEEKLVNYIKTMLGDGLVVLDVSDDQILLAIDDTFSKFASWALDAQQNMGFVINARVDIQDYYIDDRIQAIYGISIADSTTNYNTGTSGGISLGGFGQIGINYIPYVDMEGNISSLESGTGGGNYSVAGVAGGVTGGPATNGNSAENMEVAYMQMVESQTMQSMFGSSVAFDFNASNHILRIFEPVSGPIMVEGSLAYRPNPDYDDAYGHQFIKSYALNKVKFIWGSNISKYSQSLIGGATLNGERMIQEAQEELDKLDEQLLSRYSEPLGIFSA